MGTSAPCNNPSSDIRWTLILEVFSTEATSKIGDIDYIHAHLNCDLSLAELASVVNISPTYFASLFKRTMGISPHQYVIQRRVEQANFSSKIYRF
ncbi:AraC family transcriptional regulator [[Phormidium ambiguum] IAM M-71]|uniref:AraC family transcriptional regulator n=1 Tax=[Phormidium ambiguum] IAM M-71 TaxID=454136 RepID=UPI001C4A2483